MKLKFITSILAACAFLPLSAQQVNYPTLKEFPSSLYDFEENGIKYQIIDSDAKTCRTAGFNDITKYKCVSVTVNEYNWIHDVYAILETGTDNYYKSPNIYAQGNIPSVANGYKVVEVGNFSFVGGSNCKELNLSSNIEKIGVAAFKGCETLGDGYTITIPGNIETISESAFEGCGKIKDLKLEEGIKYIGDNAFRSELTLTRNENFETTSLGGDISFGDLPIKLGLAVTTDLKELTIPASVIEIGAHAFEGADLSSLEFAKPSNLTKIDDYAFACSKTLKSIEIPENVESIGDFAFYDCDALITLKFLGENLTEIGDYAFANLQKLTCLKIPNSVLTIGDFAFFKCGGDDILGCFHMSNSVQSIGDYAFFEIKIEEILELPKSLKYIGKRAFDGQANYTTDTFNREKGRWGDLYLHAQMPPEMDWYGFGSSNDDHENFELGFWIYYLVCLHVPQGREKWYKDEYILGEDGKPIRGIIENGKIKETADGDPIPNPWSQFKCIIGDLVDVGEKSLGEGIVTYAFMVPGDKMYIDELFEGTDFVLKENAEWDFIWKNGDHVGNGTVGGKNEEQSKHDKEIVKLTRTTETVDGSTNGQKRDLLEAIDFGQEILVAYRDDENSRGKEGDYAVEDTYSAAIVVFVCPRITMVYDTAAKDDSSPDSPKSVVRRFEGDESDSGEGNGDDTDTKTSDKDTEIAPYVTYEHRVVYNSLPKLNVIQSPSITVEAWERGEFANDGSSQIAGSDNLEGMDDNQLGDGADEGISIVPFEPITNDRIVKLTAAPTSFDSDNVFSGVQEVEITDAISVEVAGNTVTVVGAEPQDVVKVYDVNGQLVYSSTVKSFQIFKTGVYVATVADAAFKIAVR